MTFTVYCAFVIVGVQYGTGRHLVDIPEEDIPIAMKVDFPARDFEKLVSRC
jgi:uncharacterized protein (DUF3820 family)